LRRKSFWDRRMLCLSWVASDALHLHDGHPLSSQDLEFLSMSLSSTSKQCQQQDLALTKVKKSHYYYWSKCSGMFWGQHERVRSMVKAALDKFNETQVGFLNSFNHFLAFVSSNLHCLSYICLVSSTTLFIFVFEGGSPIQASYYLWCKWVCIWSGAKLWWENWRL
jgi:hypothetical protein